ncbi:MAG: integration host factor subunit beta [Candidatus Goldbacteria bacterium]|nr:integration host factor subunit beta [Candidatus Goldiibacteriota bacterium]
MTKVEIINKIGENIALPKKDIEKVIDYLVQIIQNALKDGQKVSITGLGSFSVKERKGRTARNPKTGEKVEVLPKKVVKFKTGIDLNEILQGKSTGDING